MSFSQTVYSKKLNLLDNLVLWVHISRINIEHRTDRTRSDEKTARPTVERDLEFYRTATVGVSRILLPNEAIVPTANECTGIA